MGASQICLLVAAVLFGVGAGNPPGLNWISAGLCFVTISWLVRG